MPVAGWSSKVSTAPPQVTPGSHQALCCSTDDGGLKITIICLVFQVTCILQTQSLQGIFNLLLCGAGDQM